MSVVTLEEMVRKTLQGTFSITDPPQDTLVQRVAQQNGFLYVEIFAGNSPLNLLRARKTKQQLAEHPAKRPLVHLAEMDVCCI